MPVLLSFGEAMRVERAGDNGWTRWIQPRMESYYIECCDCGLIHRLQYRIVGTHNGSQQHVQFRARRSRGPRMRKKP